MSNISTGMGLAILGLGIAAHPILSGLTSSATASVANTAAAAVASAATTQAGGEPTVVWYGQTQSHTSSSGPFIVTLTRAWSDGRVESRRFMNFAGSGGSSACQPGHECATPWYTINDPNSGFRAAADVNADELVDAMDLASVLNSWGDAPRVPFTPSDCPLNLVNP